MIWRVGFVVFVAIPSLSGNLLDFVFNAKVCFIDIINIMEGK